MKEKVSAVDDMKGEVPDAVVEKEEKRHPVEIEVAEGNKVYIPDLICSYKSC